MTDTKKISGLIKEQFPSFYRDEGQFFVDFVSKYYEWMESKSAARNQFIKKNKSTVRVTYSSTNLVGNNTSFDTNFSNGDQIAISTDDAGYEIFTINTISNSSFITLSTDKLPGFAHANASYANVALKPNPGYYVRRTQDSLDVDKTTNEFIVWFKETYLKNIQFSSVTDTQTLIKNSLDLYRSKGTPRSVDLLFKATFGVPAKIYYPSTDLFRVSSGIWTIPKYLELSPNENTTAIVSKQIYGVTSGAIAFCDSLIRRTVKGKLIDVAYISAISGNFQTGEKINTSNNDINVEVAPHITGSLNSLTVVSGGASSNVGDYITLTSNNGVQGRARVANTTNTSGTVDGTLQDGGYGYSANARVLVSDSILKIEDLRANAEHTIYFDSSFEPFHQPTANIIYSAGTDDFLQGNDVFTYHANGDVNGTGAILETIAANDSYGEMKIKVLSGDFDVSNIYGTGNTANATIDTFEDTTASANVLGSYANVTLQVSNIVGTFADDELITTPLGASGTFDLLSNTLGANGTISISNSMTAYHQSNVITGATSGATATIDKVDLQMGVIFTNGSFISTDNNYVYSNTLNVNGEVTFISSGTGFDFDISNNFLYSEYIDMPTDFLTKNATHYTPIALDAVAYGLGGDPNANLTSNTIANALAYSNTEIGKIRTLINFAPGISYNRIPIVRIIDDTISTFRKYDEEFITITSPTASFAVGEVITQEATDYRGFVKAANSTSITAQKLRFGNDNRVIATSNATTKIVGEDTGANASVTTSIENQDSLYIGEDAYINLNTSTANGVITNLDVVDSGFGYEHGETIYFGNSGIAVANLYTHGTANGYYKSVDGFTSNKKKLHDGEYWQTHSYEVRAPVSINKYQDMLRQVVHVAGTKMFGNLVHTSTTSVSVKVAANTGTNTVVVIS